MVDWISDMRIKRPDRVLSLSLSIISMKKILKKMQKKQLNRLKINVILRLMK